MKHLTAILCLIAASCAPKAIVVRPISEQAAVTAGAVKLVSSKTVQVEKTSERVGQDVQSLQQQVAKAQAEAERLRAAGKAASQAQLEENARAWAAAKSLAQKLEETAGTLKFDVSQLKLSVAAAEAETAKMTKKAHEADKAQRDLQKQIADMTADYELGKTIRHAFWTIVWSVIGIIVLLIVLYVFTRAGRTAISAATHGAIPP